MGPLSSLSGGANWIDSNLFVEAWVYVNSFGASSSNLITHGTNWSCGFTSSGNFQMNINNQGLTSTATVPLTTWTHVAFSFSHQTATSNLMYVFVNGTLSGGPTAFTGVPTTTNQSAYIGWDLSTKYSNFYVQDLRVSGGINNTGQGFYLVCPTSSFTPIVGPFPLDNSPPTYASGTTLYSGATIWSLQVMFKNISYTAGKFGQGIYLVNNSQGSQMARVSLPVNLPTTSPFSISVWIKVSDPYSSTYRDFVALSGSGIYITISAPGWRGVNNFEVYNNNNVTRYLSGQALDTNWFHVVLTNDGTLNNFIGYFNGGNKASGASTAVIQSATINTIFLATNGTVTISDLRVYNTALTDAQVLEVYNQGGMPVTGFFKLTGTPLFSQLSSAAQSSAVGAFSLRAVNGRTAKAVNVRRASDSTLQDFYADRLGNLLTAPVTGQTLASWLGGATGYVATWYDQSGKGNHVSQSITGNQPTISGPSIAFTGTEWFSNTATTGGPLTNGQVQYSYAACFNSANGGTGTVCTTEPQTGTNSRLGRLILIGNYAGFSGEGNDVWNMSPFTNNTQKSLVMMINNNNQLNITTVSAGTTVNNGSSTSIYNNGVNGGGTAGNTSLNLSNYQFGIGRKMCSSSDYFSGTMKSVMVFNTAISAADAAIIDAWQQSI
jgi:hypothetical protein